MKYRLTFLALAASVAVVLPSYAGGTKNISVSDALNGSVPIAVAAEGGGVILDLGLTDEIVIKATMDDQSRITVDATEGIPVLRLFVAKIPVNDVPVAKTTQLTVITQSKEGSWSTYIFPVTYSTKPAAYTKFVVGGQSERNTQTTFVTASHGLERAQQQKTLVDPRLKGRARIYLLHLKAGDSPQQARRKAKISKALAQKLDELGQSTPVTASNPTSVLPVPIAPATPTANQLPPPSSLKQEAEPLANAKTDTHVSRGSGQTDQNSLPRPIPLAKKYTNHDYANAIVRGLLKARNTKNWEIYDQRWQYNSAVIILRKGNTLDQAAKKAGVTKKQLLTVIDFGGIRLDEAP